MKKYWLFATIASFFAIPAVASIPVALNNGQQYWLLWAVFRPGNASLLDSPLEVFFWLGILAPLAFSIFCFIKLIRTQDEK